MTTWILKILPDGTKKLEQIPPTPEEVEEKERLHKEYLKRQKLIRDERKEREFPIDEFSEISEEERLKKEFFKSIEKSLDVKTSCWIWLGNKDEYKRVERKAYEAFKKKLDENSELLHKCNTPNCVNPNHLYVSN